MEKTPEGYAHAYRQALADVEALAAPLSEAQFNWKPAPDVWSVGECVLHLTKINGPYLPAFEAALARGGPAGRGPFRYGWAARKFIEITGPDTRRKLKAPPKMDPTRRSASEIDKARAMQRFREINEAFLAVCRRAEGLDLARIRMGSPFLPLLRFPVGAFLEGLAGHERRHLAQARRVTERPDFPREAAGAPAHSSPSTSNT